MTDADGDPAPYECVECGTPLSIHEAAAHIRRCCPDPPSRADLADDEDAAGAGDGTPYSCPRCPAELPLSELLDHMAIAHPPLEVTR